MTHLNHLVKKPLSQPVSRHLINILKATSTTNKPPFSGYKESQRLISAANNHLYNF
jgi:hypothetical protein